MTARSAPTPPAGGHTPTPGPWRALDKSVTLDTTDLSCIGAIATCHVRRTAQPLITAEQARANTKLLAAAPALADALEAFLVKPLTLLDFGSAVLKAKAALVLAGRLSP